VSSERSDFIKAAYRAILMRDPDSDGLATFTAQLSEDAPDYVAFLAALLGSAEFLSNIDAFMEHYQPGASKAAEAAGSEPDKDAAADQPPSPPA
jgi:hypothetical protein